MIDGHPTTVRVIVIDDDPSHLYLIKHALRKRHPPSDSLTSFEVQTYSDAAQAIAELPPQGPAVIICDYNMPGGTGVDWIPDFVRADLGPVILMTGQGSEAVASAAFRAGAVNYLVKSAVLERPALLHSSIHEALRRYRLDEQNRELSRQLKSLNRQLEQKNRKLEQLTQTAQDFVDDVAHEFRTPLAVIKEFASIIDDEISGPVTPKQHEHLEYIHGAVRDLTQMVDDFLDSGKIRAGTLRVDRRRHRVQELFDAVRTVVGTRAGRRNVRIVEAVEDAQAAFFGDLEKISRVLINLAINAVKFSPEGGEIQIWSRAKKDGFVEIGVTDKGPGFTLEQQNALFQRFKQLAHGEKSIYAGFGLGLSIALDLLHINLGRMKVDSLPGKGSTFSFVLPPPTPNDILDAYVESVVSRLSPGTIIATHVVPVGPGDVTDDFRAFLAAASRPTDLALVTADRASLVLVGLAEDPDGWLDRIDALRSKADEEGVTTFDARVVGVWMVPEECGSMREAISARLEGAVAHGLHC